MRRASLVLSFGAALLALCAPAAIAMGFGRTVTATTLGQPLNFIALIKLDVDESLARECVGADVLIGDNRVAPENVRVTLESARETGERRVRVTTRTVVDEPVVTVDVRVGCGSQMSRRFVAFVDPPALRLASAEAEEFLAPQRVDPQVAPLLDIVRSADASRRRAAPVAPGGERGDAATRASRRTAPGRRFAAAPSARSAAVHVASAAPLRGPSPAGIAGAREGGAGRAAPRLRLDAATAWAPPSARAPATSPMAGPAAVAATTASVAVALPPAAPHPDTVAAAATAAALAAEHARLQDLEAGMARLRSDGQAQQKTIAALQARLRDAEGDRYANGLVYALAAAMVFFALVAAAFWALRPRQRRRARWFDAQAQQRRKAGASVAPTPAAGEPRAPTVSQHPSQWGESARGMLAATAPATIGGLEVTTVLAPQSHYARMVAAGAAPDGATPTPAGRASTPSMEQLIDLEQQAEFYVVLGQDDAAIALLESHLGQAGGASPLPFLQLLEIHQRRGDRSEYDRVRQSYQKHFGAFAPEWSTDLHFGRALDDYPAAIARVQALWPTPLHAMQALDALLFRRDESEDAFDFPAYRELLFLYGIARDLAGQVETDFGSIDLFLPLEEAPALASANEDSRFAVDLDVSGWPDESQSEGMVIRRSVGARGSS